MTFLVSVLFTSPDRPDISFSYTIDPDDWSNANYWHDIGDALSCLIACAEHKISRIFPNGHSYQLSNVNAVYLGDDVE